MLLVNSPLLWQNLFQNGCLEYHQIIAWNAKLCSPFPTAFLVALGRRSKLSPPKNSESFLHVYKKLVKGAKVFALLFHLCAFGGIWSFRIEALETVYIHSQCNSQPSCNLAWNRQAGLLGSGCGLTWSKKPTWICGSEMAGASASGLCKANRAGPSGWDLAWVPDFGSPPLHRVTRFS